MAMTLVETVTVGSGGAASIEFTNIPQTGKDLLVLVSFRGSSLANGINEFFLRINNNDIATYTSRLLRGNGSAASSTTETGGRFWASWPIPGNDQTANTFSNISNYLSNYTSSANKSISIDGVGENNATSASQVLVAGSVPITSAITSVQLYVAAFGSNYIAQHSSASLYIIS